MKKAQNIRILIIFALIIATGSFLVVNVFVVSVGGYHYNSGTNIKEVVENIHTVYEPTLAKRGKITDYNDNTLVEDTTAYTLYAYIAPDRFGIGNVPAYVVDKETAATQISSVIGLSYEEVLNRLNTEDAKQVEFGPEGKRISSTQKNKLESFDIPGIGFTKVIVRGYYSTSLGSTLIGITRFNEDANKQEGIMGIEKNYDDVLNGKNGLQVYRQDREQYRFDTIEQLSEPTIDGKNIKLTIDKIVQGSLDKALNNILHSEDVNADEAWGAVVDVKTGRVVAISDAPSFDAEDPNTSYLNRATEYEYEPGSTMKTLTYGIALNEKAIQPDDLFDGKSFYFRIDKDTGKAVRVGPNEKYTNYIHNPFKANYPMITMKEGYQRSSNVMIAEVLTNRLNPEVFRKYLKDMGFFEPVTLGRLPGSQGVEVWDYYHEKITNGFGQGSTVTMLQLLQAHTAVFGDGTIVKPYIIESITNPNTNEVEYQAEVIKGKRVFSPETAQLVRDAMHDNVENQFFGMTRFKMDEINVLAKSGTSEMVVDGEYSSSKYIFSAMLAFPYENPQYELYFAYKAKDGHRLSTVADEMKTVIKTVISNYPIDTQQDEKDNAVHKIEIENYINRKISAVSEELKGLGYTPVILGKGDVIIDQYPKRNTTVLNNEKILFLTNSDKFSIPDMTGWSAKEVSAFSNFSKIEIEIEGSGFVTSQSIAPHSDLVQGQVISVKLK